MAEIGLDEQVTIGTYLRIAVRRMTQAGIDNPSLDARILTGHALKMTAPELLSAHHQPMNLAQIGSCEMLVRRRLGREPVGRILGMREFWSLTFGLNEAVLEPRPDSETLIHAVLEQVLDENRPLRLCDLGTGSGCLLLALLSELPNATGIGVDCLDRAVEQARLNAADLGLAARAEFRTGNWLAGINESFDIIIANPPYIPHGTIPALEPEVYDFDPKAALDGGADGLDAYRAIIPALPRNLKDCGLITLEIGFDQAAAVTGLMKQAGFTDVEVHKDLGGNNRCVSGIAPIEG